MIQDLIKRLGRSAGLEISHYRPYAARRGRQLVEHGIVTVLDVGANFGAYGVELRSFGYRGRIISLEPLPAAFSALAAQAAADPDWECHNVAIGERDGEATINVASKSGSSSLLSMNEEHRRGAPDISVVGSERVEVRRLDSLPLQARAPVMLKMDVQGYEHHVLDGCPRTLDGVALIESEISLANLYEGQPSLRELVDRLYDLGFEMFDLDPFFYDRTDGRVLSIDALFRRARPVTTT